jgi:hypothetical protein
MLVLVRGEGPTRGTPASVSISEGRMTQKWGYPPGPSVEPTSHWRHPANGEKATAWSEIPRSTNCNGNRPPKAGKLDALRWRGQPERETALAPGWDRTQGQGTCFTIAASRTGPGLPSGPRVSP